MKDRIVTIMHHRIFAIDRGMGTEYVQWTAHRPCRANIKGYGSTKQAAIDDLKAKQPFREIQDSY